MKIPLKIKIGSHWITIKDNYQFIERTDLNGQADFDTHEIKLASRWISGEFPESKRTRCFLHEILHFIEAIYCSKSIDDSLINSFAEGLLQVIRDNNLDFRNKD